MARLSRKTLPGTARRGGCPYEDDHGGRRRLKACATTANLQFLGFAPFQTITTTRPWRAGWSTEFVGTCDFRERNSFGDFESCPTGFERGVDIPRGLHFRFSGKSSLPRKYTRIFLKTICQKGIFGVALSVA